jgi:hypothetical protein
MALKTAFRCIPLALLALAFPLAGELRAQDAHYWTYGYGPIGQLTEGTLVGGVSDLSATYYNPAACALLDRPRFVFSLTSIELANIDIPDAAGPELDFDQLIFDIVPAMVAFHVGSHDKARNHFAFAFLSRHDSDFDLGVSNANVSAASPVAEAGFGRLKQRVVEYWVGGSWSRRVSEHVAVGISPFFAYRAQRSRRGLNVEDLAAGVSRAAFVGREQEYNHTRLLAKAGVAWRPGDWQLGATLTSPGVKLWANGKTIYNASVAGVGGVALLAATTQKGLPATYHSPWSVAFGASRVFENTVIHTTLEWFSAVDPYTILEPEPAEIAGRPETIPLVYSGQARSVVNFGVGFEQRLGERIHAYGGVARNQSAYVAGRDSFSPWSLVDVTGGFSVDRGRMRLAFGVGYAWGDGMMAQVLVPPDTANAPDALPAHFSRWTISFGASFQNE